MKRFVYFHPSGPVFGRIRINRKGVTNNPAQINQRIQMAQRDSLSNILPIVVAYERCTAYVGGNLPPLSSRSKFAHLILSSLSFDIRDE